MKVIDASALVAALATNAPAGTLADRRLRAGPLHAPAVIDLEVLSAVRGQVLGGRMTQHEATGVLDRLRRIPLTRAAHTPLVDRIWELRHNLTAYDASYVALAEALGVPLVTGDRRLAQAPGVRCPVEVVDA